MSATGKSSATGAGRPSPDAYSSAEETVSPAWESTGCSRDATGVLATVAGVGGGDMSVDSFAVASNCVAAPLDRGEAPLADGWTVAGRKQSGAMARQTLKHAAGVSGNAVLHAASTK